MLSSLVIVFIPRSKHFLNFMVSVTICSDFGDQENKVCHCFHCFPIYLPWSDGTMILVFWMLSFKPAFTLSSFIFIKRCPTPAQAIRKGLVRTHRGICYLQARKSACPRNWIGTNINPDFDIQPPECVKTGWWLSQSTVILYGCPSCLIQEVT